MTNCLRSATRIVLAAALLIPFCTLRDGCFARTAHTGEDCQYENYHPRLPDDAFPFSYQKVRHLLAILLISVKISSLR